MIPLIEFKDVYFKYPDGSEGLRGLNVSVGKGRKIAVLGENGAGKTTFLLHLNGILTHSKGDFLFEGEKMTKKNVKSLRKKVGIVFQDPDDQIFTNRVYDDIAYGLKHQNVAEEEIKKRIEGMADVLGLNEILYKSPFKLSFGQKKRVALAGVLVMRPEVIILDEPVTFLDPLSKRRLIEVLNGMSAYGHTIIITTHQLDFAAEWAEDFLIIHEGQLLESGDYTIFNNEEMLAKANLERPILTDVFINSEFKGTLPKNTHEAIGAINKLIEVL